MMNIMRRKPSTQDNLNLRARQEAEAQEQRDRMARPVPLPDFRLSGFDIDKMIGSAGLVSSSPGSLSDDEQSSARDYVTRTSKRTSVRSPSLRPAPSVASFSSETSSRPKQVSRMASTPQLRRQKDSALPPPMPHQSRSTGPGYLDKWDRSQSMGRPLFDGSGESGREGTRSPSALDVRSPDQRGPSPSFGMRRPQRSQTTSPGMEITSPDLASPRSPPAAPGYGLMNKIGRALKMEDLDERQAREWEEARERQNQHDRQERNRQKAVQVAEETRRRKMEEEENIRRIKAAERIERERRAREMEAERLRAQERKRKEQIMRKHEEDRKKKIAEEQARVEAEGAKKRKAEAAAKARVKAKEEAEKARVKAMEEAEKARLKAIEDAETARLKAIEDGKRAIEQAKQNYVQALTDGRLAIEREDREHRERTRKAAEARTRMLEEKGGVHRRSGGHDGSKDQHASDSGVSLPSSGDGPQASADGHQRIAPPSPAMNQLDRTANPLSDGTQSHRPSNQGGQGNVRFDDVTAEMRHLALPTRDRLPALRFASALTIGARAPPAPRSPMNFGPAVKFPWDVGMNLSQAPSISRDDGPSALAQLSYVAAIADTSDPSRPIFGEGWRSHGVGDASKIVSHYRVVPMQDVRLTKRKIIKSGAEDADETGSHLNFSFDKDDADDAASEYEEVWEEYTNEVLIFELFEHLFTRTTPGVIERVLAHLDCADVKNLRQSCKEVRFALDNLEGRETVLRRFLEPVGYKTWGHLRSLGGVPEKDPLPLSFSDVEAFLLSAELSAEYSHVAVEWIRYPHEMDVRVPRLARASTRAYTRILNRLRLQPGFKVPPPQPALLGTPMLQSPRSSSPSPSNHSRHPTSQNGRSSPLMRSAAHHQSLSPSANTATYWANPVSPWKPGRAALHRVWVPTVNTAWQSDAEIARCERELFLAGAWSSLRKGDIVWNTAMGDDDNVGRLIFDGQYLRDLAFHYDKVGHLPSWLNMFLYSPGYYHNIIRSSAPAPIVYLDILPWREQIVASLRLVQDQVETTSASGARYRIAKWLYRSVAQVQAGQIISDEGLVYADEGWAGRIVFETEGTSEHARELVARCAGPCASPRAKAQLLASIFGGTPAVQPEQRPRGVKARDNSGNEMDGALLLKNPAVKDAQGRRVDAQTPFAVLRERSRPGLIWLRPVSANDRVH
ncbi:unnamed protein product [Jaminaea pallidilutea]